MVNETIIGEFNKLIKQIQFDIDHAKNQKDKTAHMFRLQNTKRALKIISSFTEQITSSKQLKDIPGIGKNTLKRIDEIIQSSKLSEINESIISDKYMEYVDELEKIIGIGRAKAIELFTKYNIKSIDELKELYNSGKITLPDNIVKGLKYYKIYQENIPRAEMDEYSNYLSAELLKIDPELFGTICGSYRRLQLFSNDIDMIIVHPKAKTKQDTKDPKYNYLTKFITALTKKKFILDSLTDITVPTKYMGFCQLRKDRPIRRLDIRYIPYDMYYFAILYFTGPKDFNRRMRQTAIDLGYQLNEYGLWDENKKSVLENVTSEKDIFDFLGLEYLTPDKRK